MNKDQRVPVMSCPLKETAPFLLGTPCDLTDALSTRSNPATPLLGGRLKKPINEAGQGVPVSELAIAIAARSAAALHNDEFDDLLLKVVVFGEAQGGSSAATTSWPRSDPRISELPSSRSLRLLTGLRI